MLKEILGEYIETSRIVKIAKVMLNAAVRHLKKVQVVLEVERGPTTRAAGFTESALKVTVVNKSRADINIEDIRAMFCGSLGAPVAPDAPDLRTHSKLPAKLDPGSKGVWYIPAEQLSRLLKSLRRPSVKTGLIAKTVEIRARCATSTGKVYESLPLDFSTDPNSHWP